MPIPIREKLTVLHRVALASQWKSEKPSPEDLLDQLRAPVQLKILKGHTELKWGFFPLAPAHVVGSVEFVRIAWTMESMAKVFGLSPAAIQKTLDQVEGQVKKLKKAGGTRKQKKQRRPRKGK
jgi:AraC-like DNA-binding protein